MTDLIKVTERESPKRRFWQKTTEILADSPLLLEILAFGGRRETRRKPQSFAENRRFSKKTKDLRRLSSVTSGPSPSFSESLHT